MGESESRGESVSGSGSGSGSGSERKSESETMHSAPPSAKPRTCFRVSGFGFRISGFGFRVCVLGFRVLGFRFRISDFGFQVLGSGFLVSVFGFRVSDFRFRIEVRAKAQVHCTRGVPSRNLPSIVPVRVWWLVAQFFQHPTLGGSIFLTPNP